MDEKQQKLLAEAMEDLSTAPERVRLEVLKTCNKWRHIDRPCDEQEVRTDQLECWLEKGRPELTHAVAMKLRPRSRDRKIMRKHNLCMELRRWRKIKPGPEL